MRLIGSLLLLLPAAIWASLSVPTQSFPSEEVNTLRAFKQAIYNDPHSIMSDWNLKDENDADPCSWTGVSCSSARDHVTAIKLANESLEGFLSPEIGSLAFLQELVLINNSFLGTIPKQLGMLKSLVKLDLSNNRFTGPIPPEIGGLTNLSTINFHSNGLTGSLPPELGYLTLLLELRLDRNRFQGPIPGSDFSDLTPANASKLGLQKNASGLCLLGKLNVGDFSYNFFTGKVPPCLGYLDRSNFQGNCFHDGNLQRTANQCGAYRPAISNGNSSPGEQARAHFKHLKAGQPKWLLILEIVTGVVLVVFLVTAVVTAVKKCCPKSPVIIPWKRTMNSRDQTIISIDGQMLKHVLRISRQELEVACEDFSNIIGSSSDSVVYKGTMKDGPEIAVISLCISEDHWTSYLELYFQTEVANLARLNHENTAKLIGYCKETEPFSRMLVFEYASNGTLYEHLHYGEGCQLSWSRRMKIAIGIARGLRYMHTELQPPFSLSDLHSSAVYLTEDFSPKLVDFESWKAVLSKSENSGYIINGSSFHGFQDSTERRHIDIQGNTFAFGVLLLEIISGRPPFCKDRGCLVDWAVEYLDRPDTMCHLVDPELRYFNHDDLRVACSVVSLCVQSEPSKRPTMQILAAMLENGIDTSAAATLKESPLAWAELALSS